MYSVCHREKLHGIFPSNNSFGTPSDNASNTPSGTASNAPSCTKTIGELVVIISTTYDGKINNQVFFRARGL
jgi:hypothetical protein